MEPPIRFPKVTSRVGLGLGLDLPWSEGIGFTRRNRAPDGLTAKTSRFLERHAGFANALFIAFQPKNRNVLDLADYQDAYDDVFFRFGRGKVLGFHQTILNLGTPDSYDRSRVFRFTNDVIRRYGINWVVEDLGLWSVAGKAVPFPLPPFMTAAGLDVCASNIQKTQSALDVPLCIEFPGFTEGTNFHIGDLDAFHYFRTLAEVTASPVTIDIGHILSYQWLRGCTGGRMYEGLEHLPLDHCFEFHLSGCRIHNGKFRDMHHGILLDEQLDLLTFLLPRAPNLKIVTFEDPRFDDDGVLIFKSRRNWERLVAIVRSWETS
jgi:uncharacterized protein (UPF0276 family)